MNDQNQIKLDTDELQWWAYRYLDDLLSPEERVEFELLLQHDQTAREAVANDVELIGAIAANRQIFTERSIPAAGISADPTNHTFTFSWQIASKIAMSIAVCLLLMVGLQSWLVTHQPADSSSAKTEETAQQEDQVAELFFNLLPEDVEAEPASSIEDSVSEETEDSGQLTETEDQLLDDQENWYFALATVEHNESDLDENH